MASNLIAMASNLIAMASNLIAMASNLIAMASNLIAMALNLIAKDKNPRIQDISPELDAHNSLVGTLQAQLGIVITPKLQHISTLDTLPKRTPRHIRLGLPLRVSVVPSSLWLRPLFDLVRVPRTAASSTRSVSRTRTVWGVRRRAHGVADGWRVAPGVASRSHHGCCEMNGSQRFVGHVVGLEIQFAGSVVKFQDGPRNGWNSPA